MFCYLFYISFLFYIFFFISFSPDKIQLSQPGSEQQQQQQQQQQQHQQQHRHHQTSSRSQGQGSSPRVHRGGPIGPLKPEQVAKLLTELEVVRKNMDLMNELMSENEPGKENPEDMQLLDVRMVLTLQGC